MVVNAPTLLPIFRSRLQGNLLAALLLVPDAEYTLTDLARRADASLAAVQREVDRLENAGLLTSRRIGRARLVSADRTTPATAPLTELVALTFGPVEILAEEFSELSGVELLEIFGSWAARYRGERGRPPADVDVLAVGAPDRDAAHEAARRAEERIGLPVNITIVTPQRWAAAEDGFVRGVRMAARIAVPR